MKVARVKKILHIDEDTHQVSNNASFAITIATVSYQDRIALDWQNLTIPGNVYTLSCRASFERSQGRKETPTEYSIQGPRYAEPPT